MQIISNNNIFFNFIKIQIYKLFTET
jgi:hypothetical protein